METHTVLTSLCKQFIRGLVMFILEARLGLVFTPHTISLLHVIWVLNLSWCVVSAVPEADVGDTPHLPQGPRCAAPPPAMVCLPPVAHVIHSFGKTAIRKSIFCCICSRDSGRHRLGTEGSSCSISFAQHNSWEAICPTHRIDGKLSV